MLLVEKRAELVVKQNFKIPLWHSKISGLLNKKDKR
jgi:hypothetical protein